MATTSWIGRAIPTAQVKSHTVGGTAAAGQVYTVTINGKSVSYTATGGDTNTTIATALAAALNASTVPEFAEYTWSSAVAVVTSTADEAGVEGTITSSATGTGTLVTATVTSATGPTNWNDANNWSGAAVPTTGDTAMVLIPATIDTGLAQSGVTLASLVIGDEDITIGRKRINAAGYVEFRDKYLAIGATSCVIGYGRGSRGTGLCRINFGSVQTTTEVRKTGVSKESGMFSVDLLGTHASNAVDVRAGSVSIAAEGSASTVSSLTSSDQATVFVGSGVTLGTARGSGTVEITCAATTLTQAGGTWTVSGSGAVGTLTQTGGGLHYLSSGTVTTATIGSHVRCGDASTRTFTTTTLTPGGKIFDPLKTITYTNAIAISAAVRAVSAE